MGAKTRISRTVGNMAVFTTVLLLIIVVLVFWFMRANQRRITEQNQQYLEDAVAQSALGIEETLDEATKSAAMVARVYELQLDTPEFDYRLLNEMTEPTPFDYVRFVGTDGISWSGEGTQVDCGDREYFLEGMKGHTGISYVTTSRFTDQPILSFYAPLHFQGEIIGVVNGVINTDDLTERLSATFFGEKAAACICTRTGEVVAGSWIRTNAGEELQHTMFNSGTMTEETMIQVESAMRLGQPLSFRYWEGNAVGNAHMTPIAGGKFMLIQTMPPHVTEKITNRANRDGLLLEISLVVAFAIYLVVVGVYTTRRARRLRREKDDLGQIVSSVARVYRRFMVFDLDRDEYEYVKNGDPNVLGLPEKGKYSDWVTAFEKQHDAEDRYWGSTEEMQPENLRQRLTPEHWIAHQEYPTPDGRWERLSLIKLDMDQAVTSRILGAVEDISDMKEREEASRAALESAFHTAEAANEAKSDFLSRMSHDIRTPMNAIIGLTAIMGSHLDDRDRVIDCLGKITSSSKHLLGLINEVLDMSKIESGRLVLNDGEFSLPELVDDLMDIVLPTARAKHQELNVRIEGLTHENVIGDNLRLQQVCVNILSNAVKYTQENGHISMTLIEHPGRPMLGEYEFIFQDDGMGMTPEFLERIFTPFERAEDERVGSIQGTGLGMAIAQSVIQLMGGTIAVESKLGEGSKFTVHVSLRLQEKDEAAEERLAGLPVLVADDEQVACETACMMLDELGMKGEWVLTGQEAVERVTAHNAAKDDYFAVILDWKMPGMDGLETTRAIRQAVGPEVPIIILSAYDWSEIETEARAAGVTAFIGKPLFRSKLRGVFVGLMDKAGGEVVMPSSDPLGTVRERDFTGKRVLLVEDNVLNQEIAQEILEMTGLSVEVAENGKVAVERVTAAEPGYYDMIFMDIQMPIMNGYEAARAIRALPRPDISRLPIVAMTANTFSEDVQAALDAGMDQHIGKPLDFDQLMTVLEKWLS